jgi:PAS domain S-box-containing protein
MMVLDRECRVEQVNGFASQLAKRSVEEMTGLRVGEALRCGRSMDDVRGCGFGDLCGECVIRNKVLDTIENGRTNLRIEAQYDIKNGDNGSRQMNFLVSSTPISVGESPMALVTMMDMTNRVRAEKALSESEERFRALVENSPYAILLLQEGKYIYCNPAGLELMGFSHPDEVTSTDPLLHMAPEFRERIREMMKINEPGVVNEPIEIKFIHTDGSERWSFSSSVIVQMNGKPTAIIVGQDITEKKRMEMENRRLEERYQQFQRLESIGRLAGGIAHDLNNLLTPILGYGEMLLDSFKPGTVQTEQISQMVSAGEKARDLVQQLLAFSRKQTLEFSRLDLNMLIKDFSNLLRRTIAEDISIIYNLTGGKLFVAGDRGQLEQVLMNLAVNAGDAMPGGGRLTFQTSAVRIRDMASGEPEQMRDGDYLELTVSDTGAGIDQEICDQIFEPFYTTKNMSEGTGLGLATVYGIVKQHGGYIWVKSEKGAGTVFSIYLPLTADEELEKPGQTKTLPIHGGGELILLVEDDDNVRKLAGEILVAGGYMVVPFSNGAEAVEFINRSEKKIDLLVTDVVMPGLNGRQLFEILSEQDRELRVLYMSGYPDDVIAGRGIEEKALNFLQKPFSVKNLVLKVKMVLDS